MLPGSVFLQLQICKCGSAAVFAQPKPFYPLPVISLIHLQMNASCRNNIISFHSFSLVDKAEEDVVSGLSILIRLKKRLTEKPNNDACRQFECPSKRGEKKKRTLDFYHINSNFSILKFCKFIF